MRVRRAYLGPQCRISLPVINVLPKSLPQNVPAPSLLRETTQNLHNPIGTAFRESGTRWTLAYSLCKPDGEYDDQENDRNQAGDKWDRHSKALFLLDVCLRVIMPPGRMELLISLD